MALAIVGGFVMYIRPLASSVKQGLDLQGGTHVVLQAVDTPQLKVNDDALDRATHIIERRVNALGLTEPVVQRQGRDRIIVELPGVKDPEKAINMLGKTAMLEFKDPNNKTVLTGTDLKDAKAVVGNGNQPLVSMEFSDEGGQKFADVTARNVGKRIAITLDGEVLTAPVVQEAITGGRAQITGNRSMEEAQHRFAAGEIGNHREPDRRPDPGAGLQGSQPESIPDRCGRCVCIYDFVLSSQRCCGGHCAAAVYHAAVAGDAVPERDADPAGHGGHHPVHRYGG